MTDLTKSYIINKVGACKNCAVADNEDWNSCYLCNALICGKHYDSTNICSLCKYVPAGHVVCGICDCPAICNTEYDEGFSSNPAFSESYVAPTTEVVLCAYCRSSYITPNVHPNTTLRYTSFSVLIHYQNSFIGDPGYNVYRAGNDINYKLIQDGREQIIAYYKKVVPVFILPDVARIIIEYCGFAREFVFEECQV